MSAPRGEQRPGGRLHLGLRFRLSLFGDDVEGGALYSFRERRNERLAEERAPARAARLADHDLGDVVLPGVVQQGADEVVAGEHHVGAAKLLGQLDGGVDLGGAGRVGRGLVGPFHVGHGPGRVHHHVREPPPRANQALGHGVGPDQDKDPFAGRPGALHAALAHGVKQLVIDGLRHAA